MRCPYSEVLKHTPHKRKRRQKGEENDGEKVSIQCLQKQNLKLRALAAVDRRSFVSIRVNARHTLTMALTRDLRNLGLTRNQGPSEPRTNVERPELGSGEDIVMKGGKGGKRRREEKEEGNNPKSHCNAPKITPEVHCHLLMILMLVFLFIVCVCCLLFVFLFVSCLLYLLMFVVCVYAHAQLNWRKIVVKACKIRKSTIKSCKNVVDVAEAPCVMLVRDLESVSPITCESILCGSIQFASLCASSDVSPTAGAIPSDTAWLPDVARWSFCCWCWCWCVLEHIWHLQ